MQWRWLWLFILVGFLMQVGLERLSHAATVVAEAADPVKPAAAGIEKNVEKLAKDLEETKKSLMDDEMKQRKVMSSLFEINRKMKKIVSERGDLEQEHIMLETTTKKLAQRILQLEDNLKNQKALLRQRLSAIYKFGGQGIARFLFSSTSSTDLERNLKIMGVVAKRDLDLIKDYFGTVKELDGKRIKFTNRLAHLQKVEDRIRQQESQLSAENTLKSKILDKIRKSKQFAMTRLNGLRAKSSQFAVNDESGVFDLLFQPSFFEQKGMLPKPIQGRILQGFGLIKDEEHNVTLSHKGLFYSAPVGTPVKTIFGGKVSYKGELPGFGQTLIVDHGDHYYTVYAHNSRVSVEVDQEVRQNQVIAYSGEGVEDFGSGLYFEIRHFSEPYDPQQWMKGTSL